MGYIRSDTAQWGCRTNGTRHSVPSQFLGLFLRPTSISILLNSTCIYTHTVQQYVYIHTYCWTICIYTHTVEQYVYIHTYCWTVCVYTHISDCVQTAYALPLLTNNNTVKQFYTNRSCVKCSLDIYHWCAGLAVTGPIRDIGQNVLQRRHIPQLEFRCLLSSPASG
jgi:hypothetical protein